MALIRKHNTGGKADFRKYVGDKLLTDSRLSASEQELIDRELNTFEPNEDFEGSDVKKVSSPEEANSWLNSNHKEFNTNREAYSTDLTPEDGWGHEREMGDLLQGIIDSKYAGNEDAAIRDLGSMTDNNKIKQLAIKQAKEMVGKFVSGAAQEAVSNPKNKWNGLEEAKTLQNVLLAIDETKEITEKDWEAFLDHSNKKGVGWRAEELVQTEGDLEALRLKREDKDNKFFLEKSEKELKGLGIKDEERAALAGFTIKRDYEPLEDLPFLQETIKSKGYTLIGSKDDGIHILIDKDGKIVNDAGGLVTKDQLSEHYGKSWLTGDKGFEIYNSDQWESNPFLDVTKELGDDKFNYNVGRQILTKDPEFDGYSITAFSKDDFQGNVSKDKFGRRSFDEKYKFSKDGEEFEVIKGEDGVFRKEGKEKFTMPKSMSFGDNLTDEIKDYDKMYFTHSGSILSRIYREKLSRGAKKLSLNDVEGILNDFEQEFKAANKEERDVNIKANKAKDVALYLKEVLKNDKYDQVQKDRAEKILQRYTEFSSQTVYDKKSGEDVMLFNTGMFKWEKGGIIESPEDFDKLKFDKWKNGGVIKSESGGSTRSYQETAAKLAESRSDANDTPEGEAEYAGSGYHDSTGTVADSNVLDWISTGASIASFVPVVGMAGGAVSTVADAANAVHRGWETKDTWNLLSNIGFTALAGIGLGAAKGVKMAGKVGQIASKTGKLGKAGKAVGKARKIGAGAMKAGTKVASTAKTTGTVGKVSRAAKIAAKRATKMGDQVTLDSANKLLDLAKTTDSKTLFGLIKGTHAADMAKVMQTAAVKTSIVGQVGQGTVKGVKQVVSLAPSLIGNTAKYGLGALQVGSGVKGAIGVGKSVLDEGSLIEGIKKSQMADLRNAIQTSALGYGFYQNRVGAKAVRNRTKSIYKSDGKPTSTLEIIGKDGNVIDSNIAVSSESGLKDYNPNWLKRTSGKAKSMVSKKDPMADSLETYKASLKAALPTKQYNNVVKALDAGATVKVANAPGTVATTVLKDLTSNDPKEIRETLRAQRILESGDGNFFTSKWRQGKNKVYTESEFNKLYPASQSTTSTPVKIKTGPGTGKYKRSVKPMPKNIKANYKQSAKYLDKNTTAAERSAMTRQYNRQELAKKALAKRKAAKTTTKKTVKKALKGGVLSFYPGGSFTDRNKFWGNSTIPVPDWTKPAVSTPNKPIFAKLPSRADLVVSTPTAPSTGTQTPGLINNRYPRLYGKGIHGTQDYKIGDDINFDTSLTSYFGRQKRGKQTVNGIYLGPKDPKYPLFSNSTSVIPGESGIGDNPTPFDNYQRKGHERAKHYDPTLPMQIGRHALLNKANSLSADHMLRGTRVTPKTGLAKPSLTLSSSSAPQVEADIGRINSFSKHLAEGSSNYAHGIAGRLDGFERGIRMRTEAQDKDRATWAREKQMFERTALNIDSNNNQIDNYNKDQNDRANKERSGILASLEQQKGANRNELLRGVTNHFDPDRKAAQNYRRDYIHAISDPNIAGMQAYEADMMSEEKLAGRKKLWDEKQDEMKKYNNQHKRQEYQDSPEFDAWQSRVRTQTSPMSGIMAHINQLGKLWQMHS